MKKLVQLILKIIDDCLMNVTNLCLNVDVKVNLNYPDWGPPKLLIKIKTGLLIWNDFYWI